MFWSKNSIFEKGGGIVLQDPSRYSYVLVALNSSISRVFFEICQNDRFYNGSPNPEVLRRIPIVFPEEKNLESLINTLSIYLTCIHGLIYRTASSCSSGSEDYELLKFYEIIVNLLVLDTYFSKDLDPPQVPGNPGGKCLAFWGVSRVRKIRIIRF
ncbi:hypothetical protein [Methanosarcina sp. WH1]|uniref:hypothetical protein n=1 Tax=Methanosarcina sp. WH1 TaxID=1434102 RepID=UPI000615FF00|nr:hypothetical protein [Methanosarcina sp. WH1]AKB22900.1 hypothetical protein MSWH1_2629 [Methanosarcina sp. WH1]